MALTPNYGFIIPTGSDAVNLLTQCYPNFSSLDTILKPIQESGVTVATDTKVGTVHQLVRTDSSCNMFRFIATANYASGDTFTVDGASVTATAMDGTALSAGAFVINQSVVCILNNLVLTVLVSGKETTSLPASAVTYTPPTGLTSTNVQDAIGEVFNAIPVIPTITNHGLFECWANSDLSNDYSASSFSFTLTDLSSYDALILAFAYSTNELGSVKWYEFDMDYFTSAVHFIQEISVGQLATPPAYIYFYQRNVSFAVVGDTVTVSVSACDRIAINMQSGTPLATQTSNSNLIPVRVLALKHNS